MSKLKVSSISHRTGSGIVTIPTDNRILGTDVGSVYAPGGQVIQTIYKRVDDKLALSFAAAGSTGSFITQLDTSITPKYSTSKILIQACLTFEVQNDTVFRLYRDTTPIGINVNDSNYWSGTWVTNYDPDLASTPNTQTYFYMDSPGLNVPLTYRIMIQSAGVAANTFYLNRSVNSTGQGNYEVAISQIIIQEIAA